jgi:hypothetical protein
MHCFQAGLASVLLRPCRRLPSGLGAGLAVGSAAGRTYGVSSRWSYRNGGRGSVPRASLFRKEVQGMVRTASFFRKEVEGMVRTTSFFPEGGRGDGPHDFLFPEGGPGDGPHGFFFSGRRSRGRSARLLFSGRRSRGRSARLLFSEGGRGIVRTASFFRKGSRGWSARLLFSGRRSRGSSARLLFSGRGPRGRPRDFFFRMEVEGIVRTTSFFRKEVQGMVRTTSFCEFSLVRTVEWPAASPTKNREGAAPATPAGRKPVWKSSGLSTNNHMATQAIPDRLTPLIVLAEDAADGAEQHGAPSGSCRNTAAKLRFDLNALMGDPLDPSPRRARRTSGCKRKRPRPRPPSRNSSPTRTRRRSWPAWSTHLKILPRLRMVVRVGRGRAVGRLDETAERRRTSALPCCWW